MKTVAEITRALQELRTSMTQSMSKRRIEEQKMKSIEAEIQGMNAIIKEKEAAIRSKEVEIQRFRQMIMETRSLIPRKENELKKVKDDYAQARRESDMHQQSVSELQRELEEAQHVRPRNDSATDHHHF